MTEAKETKVDFRFIETVIDNGVTYERDRCVNVRNPFILTVIFNRGKVGHQDGESHCYLCDVVLQKGKRLCDCNGEHKVSECTGKCGAWQIEHVVARGTDKSRYDRLISDMLPACHKCNNTKRKSGLITCVEKKGLHLQTWVLRNEDVLCTEANDQLRKGHLHKRISDDELKCKYREAINDQVQRFPFDEKSIVEGWHSDKNRISCGGQGSVFRASLVNSEKESTLAIKLVPITHTNSLIYVLDEINALSRLFHRNIVPALGFFLMQEQTQQFVCIVMPNHETTLHAVTVPWGKMLDKHGSHFVFFYYLASALTAIHQQGFLHRDIKPANILVHNETLLPLICDFGTSRMASESRTSGIGTASYRDPMTRNYPCTFASDVYSFGKVLDEIARSPPSCFLQTETITLQTIAKHCMASKNRWTMQKVKSFLGDKLTALNISLDECSLTDSMSKLHLGSEQSTSSIMASSSASTSSSFAAVFASTSRSSSTTCSSSSAYASASSVIVSSSSSSFSSTSSSHFVPLRVPLTVSSSSSSSSSKSASAYHSCTTILKSGVNKGQQCGRPLPCRFHSSIRICTTCTAILKSGVNKGQRCGRPLPCGYHS
eukprot:TRINITY_DN7688_c0_g1_i1.p1 TRINITY_DN7688_c0_g1~~TRINITY_DN7688_c0_g1_i1.p1  ORF type:complete len:602 (+),score=110.99 TRINITY_DN7688_c0_g1_i1:82-1887(+)